MNHPKPWKADRVDATPVSDWCVMDAAGVWVAYVSCGMYDTDDANAKDLALEIVRAVNAHEALVGANSQDPHPYSIGEIDGKWRVLLHGKDAGLLPCTDRSLAVIASQFANSGYSQALTLAKETT